MPNQLIDESELARRKAPKSSPGEHMRAPIEYDDYRAWVYKRGQQPRLVSGRENYEKVLKLGWANSPEEAAKKAKK